MIDFLQPELLNAHFLDSQREERQVAAPQTQEALARKAPKCFLKKLMALAQRENHEQLLHMSADIALFAIKIRNSCRMQSFCKSYIKHSRAGRCVQRNFREYCIFRDLSLYQLVCVWISMERHTNLTHDGIAMERRESMARLHPHDMEDRRQSVALPSQDRRQSVTVPRQDHRESVAPNSPPRTNDAHSPEGSPRESLYIWQLFKGRHITERSKWAIVLALYDLFKANFRERCQRQRHDLPSFLPFELEILKVERGSQTRWVDLMEMSSGAEAQHYLNRAEVTIRKVRARLIPALQGASQNRYAVRTVARIIKRRDGMLRLLGVTDTESGEYVPCAQRQNSTLSPPRRRSSVYAAGDTSEAPRRRQSVRASFLEKPSFVRSLAAAGRTPSPAQAPRSPNPRTLGDKQTSPLASRRVSFMVGAEPRTRALGLGDIPAGGCPNRLTSMGGPAPGPPMPPPRNDCAVSPLAPRRAHPVPTISSPKWPMQPFPSAMSPVSPPGSSSPKSPAPRLLPQIDASSPRSNNVTVPVGLKRT
mmetsp:Transcript_30920/g.55534  ORF Transcript_30920/g.55534 Transcript_30920/m.55534 type:complete len:533 (-) Transcript_30920:2220-3818(-)